MNNLEVRGFGEAVWPLFFYRNSYSKHYIMTKAWWAYVKVNYPDACDMYVYYIRNRYREDWRMNIKNHKELVHFFENQDISVNTVKQPGKDTYGFKIDSSSKIFQSRPIFPTRNKALNNALKWAFAILDEQIDWNQRRFHQKKYPDVHPRPYRK